MSSLFKVTTISIFTAMTFSGVPPIFAFATQNPAPLEQFDFATGLFEREMYQMAAEEYNKFIDSFPQSEYVQDAYFGLAESYYFLKRYDKAIREYEKYIEKFPTGNKVLLANLRIGEALFFAERFDDAINQFRSIEKGNFKRDQMQALNFYTAKAYRAKGKKKDAIRYFNKAIKIIKDNECAFHSYVELGDIHAADFNYKEALKYYSQAHDKAISRETKSFSLYKVAEMQFLLGDYVTSAQTFKKVLKDYPESEINAEALSNLLLSLYNIKRYEDLIAEYTAHEHLLKEEDRFFDVYFTVSLTYAELNNYDKSLSTLDLLLSSGWVNQENVEKALLKKTEILLRANRFKEALDVIEGRLSKQGQYTDHILFLKGEALYGLGNFNEAALQFSKLIKEFPASPFTIDATYSMGYVQKSLGKNKEGRDFFINYYEKARNNDKRRVALYNAILLDIKENDLENAVSDSQMYLATFKDGEFREKVLFRLAAIYSELNDYDRAIDTYKEFVESYKNSPELQDAYFQLAYNLQLKKNFDEALKYYKKIKRDKDVNSLYYYALKNQALIYFAQEKNGKAAEVYEHIISEFPDNDLGVDGYLWLAKYTLKSRCFEDTIRILEKAKGREDAKDRIKEIAYFMAEAYREIKYFSKAIENYDIVLAKGEANTLTGASHIGKGLCLIETEELDRAKEEFEAAILENPEDNTITMQARFEIAGIEHLKGNLDEAYKLYMMVAILYDDEEYCPRALLSAGDIFQNLGKIEEAKKAYRELIDRYGKTGFVRNARERLKNLR